MTTFNPFGLAGSGLGLRRELLPALQTGVQDTIAFFEVSPENWVGIGGQLDKQFRRLTERHRFMAHGFALSLGHSGHSQSLAHWLCVLESDIRKIVIAFDSYKKSLPSSDLDFSAAWVIAKDLKSRQIRLARSLKYKVAILLNARERDSERCEICKTSL